MRNASKVAQKAPKSPPKPPRERVELPQAWRSLRSIFPPEVRRRVAQAFRRGLTIDDILALELAIIASLAVDPVAHARYLSAHVRHAKELAETSRIRRDRARSPVF